MRKSILVDVVKDFKKRRAFFKQYLQLYHVQKYVCESCGFPVLDDKGVYDVCIICNWEDNGYNDEQAEDPNHSCTEKLTLTAYRIQIAKEILEQPQTVKDFKRIIKAIYRYDRFEESYDSHQLFSLAPNEKDELERQLETALNQLKQELRILM